MRINEIAYVKSLCIMQITMKVIVLIRWFLSLSFSLSYTHTDIHTHTHTHIQSKRIHCFSYGVVFIHIYCPPHKSLGVPPPYLPPSFSSPTILLLFLFSLFIPRSQPTIFLVRVEAHTKYNLHVYICPMDCLQDFMCMWVCLCVISQHIKIRGMHNKILLGGGIPWWSSD